MDLVNIKINGQSHSVSKDWTILQAGRHCQIDIPTLCAYKDMMPTANCRMCVVEVEGARTLLTACSTKVSEGMVIETHSDKIKTSRKMTLELILSRYSVDCHHCARIGSSKIVDLNPRFCEMCFFCDCVREGFCELQTLARAYGVDKLPYTIESTCVGCGKCLDVCPTGAIFMKEQKDELLYYAYNLGTTTVAHISKNIIEPLAELFQMPKKFVETFYPDYLDKLVTYPSSQALFSRWSKKGNNKLISITNDHDNQLAGLTQEGIDYVLNAREFYRLFMRKGFNPKCAENISLDPICPPDQDDLQSLGLGLEEKNLKVMSVSTLGQARQELEEIKKATNDFDVLRIRD